MASEPGRVPVYEDSAERRSDQASTTAQLSQLPTVEIVIPVYNEEAVLASSVSRLRDALRDDFPYDWSILIANNASTDGTLAAAQALADDDDRVRVLHLDQKGRGRALRTAWLASSAEIVAYMDVDLSTDLDALPALIAAIADDRSDIAIGSRLVPGARTNRQWKREVISRGYNLLVRLMFWNHFRDAQCGFKAIRRSVAERLLPEVENQAWFFDTELLLLAEERGLRIIEIPVKWDEDLDSRVKVGATALEDLRGLLRVRRRRWRRTRGSPRQTDQMMMR